MNSRRKISAFSLSRQIQQLREETLTAIDHVLDSGHFILSTQVAACEKNIAGYVGTKYAVACASGTDALHLTLRALGIQSEDEVITSAFTFAATAEAIAYTGAVPIFADIDSISFNLSPASVAERISAKTKAVIAVHLFGHPAAMDELQELCRDNHLFLIEDCAQAFGARYQDKTVGSIADVGCHSFYPTKNLSAYGDGGMITLNDSQWAENLCLLRNHGDAGKYDHRVIGYNSRLDELQAAILRVKLKYLDELNARRQRLARRYHQLLSPLTTITVPKTMPECEHVYNQYTIRVPQREKIRAYLFNHGIESCIYYPRILPDQMAFSGWCQNIKRSYPHALSAAKVCLSLPLFPEMPERDVDDVAQILIDACKQ